MPATHEVTNQTPPLTGFDLGQLPTMQESLHREGAAWSLDGLAELGSLAGSEHWQDRGRWANEHPPVLKTHDRYGHRVDQVEFHPAYHELMTVAVGHGLAGAPWADPRPGAHVARAGAFMTWNVDAGHGCPVSMTYAIVPALRANPALSAAYEPGLTSRTYDPVLAPPATKAGLTAGMSMTEKQGGSDVRANTSFATPNADGTYELVGHKWFTSAPMSDMFLTLAQTTGGLSCFLLERVLPDGSSNAFRIQRLKDKLGNKSNASSEVEYDGATVHLVGQEGRGVRTIIEMVNNTRLDCCLGSTASMATALAMAAHHTTHREAFGSALVDQPLMRVVLADLAVESEAAMLTSLRLASLTDRAQNGDAEAAALRRLALAVSKYWICKRAPAVVGEALECFGGNGYAEESGMPRIYREAPLMSIWEGSGNVAALDALRGIAKEPQSLVALLDDLALARGVDARYDAFVDGLAPQLADLATLEPRARRVVEQLALAWQGSLLLRFGHPAVADAFCASRLGGDWGTAFGTLPTGVDTAAILERVTPKSS